MVVPLGGVKRSCVGDSEVNVAGVPHGAKVLFQKNAGVKVPWDEGLRLLETKEVLATVDEIGEDELS